MKYNYHTFLIIFLIKFNLVNFTFLIINSYRIQIKLLNIGMCLILFFLYYKILSIIS